MSLLARWLACCEEILKEKKRCLTAQSSVLHFLKRSSGTYTLPPVLLDSGDDDSDDWPAVSEEVPLCFHLFVRYQIVIFIS